MKQNETISRLLSLHAQLNQLEQFINYKDILSIGKPNAVALRYTLPFDCCHLYIEDEAFVKGVIALAKRHMKQIQNEILTIADGEHISKKK